MIRFSVISLLAIAASILTALFIFKKQTVPWDVTLPSPIRISMEDTFHVSLSGIRPDQVKDVLFEHFCNTPDVARLIKGMGPRPVDRCVEIVVEEYDEDDGTSVRSYDFRGRLIDDEQIYYQQEVSFWFNDNMGLVRVGSVVYIYSDNFHLYLKNEVK